MSPAKIPAGGAWLIEELQPCDIFTPERFDDDIRQMSVTMRQFGEKEIATNAAKMDTHDHTTLLRVFKAAADLGYVGIDIPEAHGGLGLGLRASVLAFEQMCASGSGSFAVTYGAHTGIGTVPVLLYGNDVQRQRFLPRIATGESIAAYALTEPGSGSDALAAKTTATLSPDGRHWIVNGGKLFITNAGFADIFTVFVKIGGKNSCLLVERGTPGFSIGKEEEKIGIRGSSTCSLSFDDAKVPVANLLGDIGKGHKIVMNTLNIGRLKLAAGNVGLIKTMTTTAAQFAKQRKQFGKPLAEFDGIVAKLADMAVAGWVGESAVYRTAGLVADRTEAEGAMAIEEHSLECALIKVALSEMSHAAVDEALQIHGGVGYTEEYPVARAYRDSRINRIFEGTSEINRLAVVDALTKQAMKGKLDLLGALANVGNDKTHPPIYMEASVQGARRATLYTVGRAVQTLMTGLASEQQILFELADMLIAVYLMESSLLRFSHLKETPGTDPEQDLRAVVGLSIAHGRRRIAAAAETVFAALKLPTDADRALELLGRPSLPTDFVASRKQIGAAVIAADGYPF